MGQDQNRAESEAMGGAPAHGGLSPRPEGSQIILGQKPEEIERQIEGRLRDIMGRLLEDAWALLELHQQGKGCEWPSVAAAQFIIGAIEQLKQAYEALAYGAGA